jgi:BirA family transcriptional regulator, biotin operon repressor / biotin---[acetyl-CoA-carboxylase] ligase
MTSPRAPRDSSPWSDLDRPPLREAALRSALVVDGSLWRDLRVVDRTASTNADVAAAARAGSPEGLVMLAEEQTAGRGRAGRTWRAPARSGLALSVLLRPPLPRESWGWLPLLAGVSVTAALREPSGLDLGLKWPNDVLVDGERKLAGVLAEVVEDAVVLGLGLNVSLRRAELPVPTATSLALEGSEMLDRDPVVRAVLRELARRYRGFVTAGGDPDGPTAETGLRSAYRSACVTLGRSVRVELPGDREVSGEAVDIDRSGRLLVRSADGTTNALAAGDVAHVR